MFDDLENLNRKYPSFKIESGHRTCHPETCSCWDIRVYDKNNVNVLNSNNLNLVITFLEENTP